MMDDITPRERQPDDTVADGVETIEARLERKAAAADVMPFKGKKSLGQMTYEERDKLLFGE